MVFVLLGGPSHASLALLRERGLAVGFDTYTSRYFSYAVVRNNMEGFYLLLRSVYFSMMLAKFRYRYLADF